MLINLNFSKNDFLEVLSNYTLGSFKDSKAFPVGSVQTNVLIHTEKGKFVFRHYRQNRSLHSVLFEVNLIRYLKSHNFPCPAPIKNKYGKYVDVYNNIPFVIFEFIEGHHLENPNEKQKMQLVKKVAELQNITKNYRPCYKQYRWNYTIDLCRELAQREAKKIGTTNSGEKLKWLNDELSKLNLPKSLPKGICHCDFHFTNVLYLNNKFNALIDFDDANYTYLTFDLICLIEPFKSSFCWNNWKSCEIIANVFDFSETRKIVAEYSKYRELSDNEKRYFFDVYKLGILFDCIWYFNRGVAKDFFEKRKIDHLNVLGRMQFYEEVFS